MSTTAWEFEHTVECSASRSFVWAFWTDVSNWERIEDDAVEWIRLEGPFEAGTRGVTKLPGQEPRSWVISRVAVQESAKIDMPVDDAVFVNQMTLESIDDGHTRIRQRLALEGEVPTELVEGMRTFESTAPEGLAKLASAIEESQRNDLGGERLSGE